MAGGQTDNQSWVTGLLDIFPEVGEWAVDRARDEITADIRAGQQDLVPEERIDDRVTRIAVEHMMGVLVRSGIAEPTGDDEWAPIRGLTREQFHARATVLLDIIGADDDEDV